MALYPIAALVTWLFLPFALIADSLSPYRWGMFVQTSVSFSLLKSQWGKGSGKFIMVIARQEHLRLLFAYNHLCSHTFVGFNIEC